MKTSSRILNYGSLNIDLVYQVPHIVRPGETISSRSFLRFAGGKGANQSVAIARAGGTVCHAGKVGRDGEWLVKQIAGCGVDTRFIRVTGDPSGHAVIQVDEAGENAIFLYPGTNMQIRQDEIDRVLSRFGKGDVLLLQNEISEVAYLISAAQERKMTVCLNPAPMDKRVKKYPLGKVNLLILNEVEGAAISGTTKPAGILDFLARQYRRAEVVLTLGRRGAMARLPGQGLVNVPAYPVKPVDTTAAGDTFIGYYLAGKADGKSADDCLRLACAAAALCVTRRGAIASIPAMEMVQAFLKKQR